MPVAQVDEQTPLLRGRESRTPIPWFQFSLVIFLQLCEPLSSQVIYPFAPQLVREIGITHGNEAKIGYYAGIMESVFFLSQALTVLPWSQISDRIGRKPVILAGLCGLSLSMYCFGLSQTFWGHVLSRSFSGALNGNISVIKSIIAEMTDTTNRSQAYAFMPIAWSTGATLGPMIGGLLERPAERFPRLFGHSEFHKKHPYFLPCAVPATFAAIAWPITFFFLEETVPSPLSFSRIFGFRKAKVNFAFQNDAAPQEPFTGSICSSGCTETSNGKENDEKPLPLLSLLTPRVVIAAANYASLSLIDIAFRATQPLFLSTPIHLGGLGLPPSTIGKLLSIYGVLYGLFQFFFFAKIHDRLGSKRLFMAGIMFGFPMFACFPIISYVAETQGLCALVWVIVGLQIVMSICLCMSYGAIFIYIAAASPNRASLGATNGLSQLSVSIMRAIGPAAANSLFSLSIEKGYLGQWLVYYVLIGMVGVSMVVASMLPRQIWVT